MKVVTALLLSIAALLAAFNLVFFFPRAVDDLFIFLRYAENLVNGEGLVFNPGEWVEGYSSLSWVLLQALGIAVGLDGLTTTKLLSLGATLALLFGIHRMGRELFELPPLWAAAALLVVASNSYLLSWCIYGLETPLYLALFVWFAVLVGRVARGSSLRTRIILALVGVILALSRPEAPLFMAVLGPGAVCLSRSRQELLGKVRRLAWPALAVVGAYGGWLLLRRMLYGLWVPHTYFAKRGTGLTLSNLEPLYAQGAPLVEQLFWMLAIPAVVIVAIVTKRLLAPLVFGVGLFFIARVEMDWMPNVRHFLPLWLISTLAVTSLAHLGFSRARDSRTPIRLLAIVTGVATTVLVSLLAHWLISIDSRYSPYDYRTHGRGEIWIRHKTRAEWSSVMALLARRDPPGFENRDPDRLGLIQLTFDALEASSQPEHESWFLGRDIGMIGYFSPIRIWDTDGLFTPGAIRWTGGVDRQPVDDGGILEAFSIQPVAGDIYFGWSAALGRNSALLQGYELVSGSLRQPNRFVQTSAPRPDLDELERRYSRVLAKNSPWFHFSELYGNPASPAIELRARFMVERARLTEEVFVSAESLPPLEGQSHSMDGAVRLLGCTLEPTRLRPGERSLLSCYFRRAGAVRRSYRVFVHGDAHGQRLIHTDHAFAQGAVRLRELPMSSTVVSRTWLRVPQDTPAGMIPLYVGLFEGSHRAQVNPQEGTDGDNRVEIGSLEVSSTLY